MDPGLRYTQCQLPCSHPIPTFSILPIDACSLKLTDLKRIAPLPPTVANSGPLGAGWGYGSLLPPESRLAFPVSGRPLYGWCSGRSGTSWAGVAACIPRHDGLDLHSCTTLFPFHVLPFWLLRTPNTEQPIWAGDCNTFEALGGLVTLLQAPEAVHAQLTLVHKTIHWGASAIPARAVLDGKPKPASTWKHLQMPAPRSSCGSPAARNASSRAASGALRSHSQGLV